MHLIMIINVGDSITLHRVSLNLSLTFIWSHHCRLGFSLFCLLNCTAFETLWEHLIRHFSAFYLSLVIDYPIAVGQVAHL